MADRYYTSKGELGPRAKQKIRWQLKDGRQLEDILKGLDPDIGIFVNVSTNNGTRNHWDINGAYLRNLEQAKIPKTLGEKDSYGVIYGTLRQLTTTGIPAPYDTSASLVKPEQKDRVYELLANSILYSKKK